MSMFTLPAKSASLNISGASSTSTGVATGSATGPATVAVAVAAAGANQQQQQATIIETTGGQPQQHVVTQQENADGTQSLQIAHVQSLQGHQLTIGSLNQVLLKKE